MKEFVIISIALLFFSCRSEHTINNIDQEYQIGIENQKVAVCFDKKTGQLKALINKITKDNYIKKVKEGSLFRIYVNTTSMPLLKAGSHNNNYGGVLIEPSNCYLHNYTFQNSETEFLLQLTYRTIQVPVEVDLFINLNNQDVGFDTRLRVRNLGNDELSVYAAFPYFSGVCLGKDATSNLSINMWDRGYPGSKAWSKILGGVYGKEVMMQWQCVYEPSLKEGLAIISKDTMFMNKIYSTVPSGGLNVLYFDQFRLKKEMAYTWPETKILAYNGSWRKAAKVYGDWFYENVKARKIPSWYKNEVVKRSSIWLPKKEDVAINKSKKNKRLFTSFRQLHNSFHGSYNDCMEIAMWNEGVNLWAETYGPWMSSGFIDFRSDLGGLEDFKKGIKECHKYGRRVGMYVAGYGIRKESPLLGGDWKKYAIIKNTEGDPLLDYRQGEEVYGAFCCPGYKPWQDNIIRICCMLAEAGVDEIRLDELGFPFKPCFNLEHHHKSPYNSNRWMRTLLKRVRLATDSINPDLFISTEFFMDYFHESTNGALVMDCAGHEIDAMKVALSEYLPLSYHASSSEAAFTGAIMSKTESLRRNWAWEDVGTEKPDDYCVDYDRQLRWHELASTFQDAVVYGEISEWDPIAINNSKWMGHLWKSENYWVLTGGYVDGAPLAEEVLIRLPEVPKDVNKAYEFNIETLQMKEVNIHFKNGEAYVKSNSSVAAILFPFKNCMPLPIVKQRNYENKIQVKVSLFSPWNSSLSKANLSRINIHCPGFEVSEGIENEYKVFNILLNQKMPENEYHYSIVGDCLKLKRWFKMN